MKKKVNKINVLLFFLLLFCSNCSKYQEKCITFSNFRESHLESAKNIKKIIQSNEMYAQFRCDF